MPWVLMPQRIQLRRTKGWRKPEGAVVVARPTKWGNPIRWQDYPKWSTGINGDPYDEPARIPDAARRRFAAVDFDAAVRLGIGYFIGYPSVAEIRRELAGKDLCCWCPLDEKCHADTLLMVANCDLSDLPLEAVEKVTAQLSQEATP